MLMFRDQSKEELGSSRRSKRIDKYVSLVLVRCSLSLLAPVEALSHPIIIGPATYAISHCDVESYAYLKLNMLAYQLGDMANILDDARESVVQKLLECLQTNTTSVASNPAASSIRMVQ
jgi:hypothetical protein